VILSSMCIIAWRRRDFEKEKLISEDELERGEAELQKLTDRYVEDVAELGKRKEVEIMEV
jgi:ribosome recycling factor